MKLDIRLLRRILNTIQEKDSHYTSVKNILEDVKTDYEEIDKETFKDLFYGHLLLLKDNKVIEEVSNTLNLGLGYNINGQMITNPCFIRLTSSGYDYLKMLNKNGFIDKIKNLTLTEGLKIGEFLIVEYAKQKFSTLL